MISPAKPWAKRSFIPQWERGLGSQVRRVPASSPVVPQVAAVAPAQLLQGLRERREAGLSFRIVHGQIQEHADASDALARLRARRERPRRRYPAEQRDDLAPPDPSIPSSARVRSVI